MNYEAYVEEKRMLHARCARENPNSRCVGEWQCQKCQELYKKYFKKIPKPAPGKTGEQR